MGSHQPRSAVPWVALTIVALFAIVAAAGVMIAPAQDDAEGRFALLPPRVEAPGAPAPPPTLPDLPISPS